MNKVRFITIFLGSLSLTFIIGITISIYRSHALSREYPELSTDDALNDEVLAVIRDARASARVTFKSKQKFTLPAAWNSQYEVDNLSRMVLEGDSLLKKAKSDTVILRRDNRDYLFVSYKSIK